MRSPALTPQGAAQHLGNGADEDHDVAPRRPQLDVLVVEASPFCDVRVASQSVDLRPAGEPGREAVTVSVAGDLVRVTRGELWPFGSRADQAHVAAQHRPQLRDL